MAAAAVPRPVHGPSTSRRTGGLFVDLSVVVHRYSPGASPTPAANYDYDLLVDDVFAVADAYFGKDARFHVVAHDQGARVAWHAIGLGQGRSRFATFTSLSIPHLDAFSDMMIGDDAELEQQTNYGYVRQLTLPNSTTAYQDNIWNKVCKPYGYPRPRRSLPSRTDPVSADHPRRGRSEAATRLSKDTRVTSRGL